MPKITILCGIVLIFNRLHDGYAQVQEECARDVLKTCERSAVCRKSTNPSFLQLCIPASTVACAAMNAAAPSEKMKHCTANLRPLSKVRVKSSRIGYTVDQCDHRVFSYEISLALTCVHNLEHPTVEAAVLHLLIRGWSAKDEHFLQSVTSFPEICDQAAVVLLTTSQEDMNITAKRGSYHSLAQE